MSKCSVRCRANAEVNIIELVHRLEEIGIEHASLLEIDTLACLDVQRDGNISAREMVEYLEDNFYRPSDGSLLNRALPSESRIVQW